MKKRTIIIGGGTFNHVRAHLSLAAPAFGTTAKKIHKLLFGSELILTKMADPDSELVTNNDVESFIDELLMDETIGTIVLNSALCDYIGVIDYVTPHKYAPRLKTSEGDQKMTLIPAVKLIKKIRIKRPDIFLVGFKTTAGEKTDEQFLTALRFMKSTKCNLVLANDLITRHNMIITPEETSYSRTTNRNVALKELCEFIKLRQDLTYHRTELHQSKNWSMSLMPTTFQTVIKFLIDNGGFIENNGNGFTPGHFCVKVDNNIFYSSQRKTDHRKIFEEDNGLTKVFRHTNGTIHAYGRKKPSVGATSQRLIFDKFPEYDCIIHTHNPMRPESILPTTPQKPYQCGSLECGINTVDNMKKFDNDIAGVFLFKHGANILFKSTCDPEKVIQFISQNVRLGVKES